MVNLKHVIVSLLLVTFMASASLAMDDAIIAVVNDELITLKELKDYIQITYVNLASEGMDEKTLNEIKNDLQANGIHKLIEDKLILSEANKLEMEVRAKAVDDRIEKIKANYPSEQDFIVMLIENGSTITDLRNKITDQFKIKFAIDHFVRSKVFVNPQEVTNYYEENKQKFQKPEQANLQSIFIKSQDDKAAAQQKAKKAYDEIKIGKDFTEVARQYSDIPSIGLIERGQLLADIEEKVFSLTEGEISGIITVDAGFYIFKLMNKIPAQVASLQDVKEDIKNFLFQENFRERYTQWIEELKKSAYVEIK
ncbi:MAG: peptidyl-prolyl cis-trans isomerase [Candidatus Omnitrophota bacterium]|nr:peptidyl-prolyl cis-trans isomerase [Candidatus Omnitrophota bacterium]